MRSAEPDRTGSEAEQTWDMQWQMPVLPKVGRDTPWVRRMRRWAQPLEIGAAILVAGGLYLALHLVWPNKEPGYLLFFALPAALLVFVIGARIYSRYYQPDRRIVVSREGVLVARPERFLLRWTPQISKAWSSVREAVRTVHALAGDVQSLRLTLKDGRVLDLPLDKHNCDDENLRRILAQAGVPYRTESAPDRRVPDLPARKPPTDKDWKPRWRGVLAYLILLVIVSGAYMAAWEAGATHRWPVALAAAIIGITMGCKIYTPEMVIIGAVGLPLMLWPLSEMMRHRQMLVREREARTAAAAEAPELGDGPVFYFSDGSPAVQRTGLRVVDLDGKPHTVVPVVPADWQPEEAIPLWVLFSKDNRSALDEMLAGRLSAGWPARRLHDMAGSPQSWKTASGRLEETLRHYREESGLKPNPDAPIVVYTRAPVSELQAQVVADGIMTVILSGLGLMAVPLVRWKCRYGSQREILELLAEERDGPASG